MLTKQSMQSASEYATVLSSKGYSVYAVPGTPLGNLAQATRAPGNSQVLDITGTDAVLNEYIDSVLYMANTKDKTLEGSPHDFAMDEMIALLGPNVAGHFSNVRNKVKTDIVTFVESISAGLEASDNEDITKHFEVKVWRPAAPISNGTLAPYYEKYSDTSFMTVKLNTNLPDFTDVQIKETMLTLNPTADMDIVEWMAVKGSSFFNNVWSNIFQIKDGTPWHELSEAFADKECGVDNALAVFLLANKLYDNPPENTNMSLSVFNTHMVDYRNQAALYLNDYASRYESSLRNEVLVRNINKKCISVAEVVYKKWIEEGGRNEVLFGLSLRDGIRDFTKKDINVNAQDYLNEWTRFASYARAANKVNRFSFTRTLLKETFVKQFTPNEALLRSFSDMLSEITEKDVANIWDLSKRLICRTVYCATDAEIILNDIEAIATDSPNMDMREVSALAMLKYLTRWGASQLRLSK